MEVDIRRIGRIATPVLTISHLYEHWLFERKMCGVIHKSFLELYFAFYEM